MVWTCTASPFLFGADNRMRTNVQDASDRAGQINRWQRKRSNATQLTGHLATESCRRRARSGSDPNCFLLVEIIGREPMYKMPVTMRGVAMETAREKWANIFQKFFGFLPCPAFGQTSFRQIAQSSPAPQIFPSFPDFTPSLWGYDTGTTNNPLYIRKKNPRKSTEIHRFSLFFCQKILIFF